MHACIIWVPKQHRVRPQAPASLHMTFKASMLPRSFRYPSVKQSNGIAAIGFGDATNPELAACQSLLPQPQLSFTYRDVHDTLDIQSGRVP